MRAETTVALLAALLSGCAQPTPESAPNGTGAGAEVEVAEWRGYTPEEMESLGSQLDLINWDDGGEISRFAFLNTSSLFPTATLHSGTSPSKVGYSLQLAIAEYQVALADGTMTFDEYVDQAALDGIVILQGGEIVYERYPRMRATDSHLLFSISKVYASTLVAILEDRGTLSADEPIERYIPELASSGWGGTSVDAILDMASGIDALEWVDGAYTDPVREHYQYEASLGWLPKVESLPASVHEEATYQYLASLERLAGPGERLDYVSVNSAVLGWLIEELTGRSFPEVLSDEIWSKIGAEDDGLVSVNSSGIAAVHAGVIATLRDVARFGLLFTPSYTVVGQDRLVSDQHLEKIRERGRPELMAASAYSEQRPSPHHVSYQWQVYEDGSFFKGGFGGQGLYVDPTKDIVLAFFGTHGYGEGAPTPLEVCLGIFAEMY